MLKVHASGTHARCVCSLDSFLYGTRVLPLWIGCVIEDINVAYASGNTLICYCFESLGGCEIFSMVGTLFGKTAFDHRQVHRQVRKKAVRFNLKVDRRSWQGFRVDIYA